MNRGTLKIETSHTQGVQVSLILSDDGTVWMSVEEIAHTFNILAASVVRQIKNILAAGELYEKEVRREQTTTLPDGRLCITEYYNLDMIIALCFSIRSYPCVVFRRWIRQRIVQTLKSKPTTPLILQIRADGIINGTQQRREKIKISRRFLSLWG